MALSADTCRRMARLEAGEHGAGSSGERQWLDMAAEARGGADWVCATCGTLGAGGPEAAGWQLCCPHCDAIDSLVWRAAGGASRQGAALGSIILDQLPAAEAPAPVAAPAPSAAAAHAGHRVRPNSPWQPDGRRTGASRGGRGQTRQARAPRRIG